MEVVYAQTQRKSKVSLPTYGHAEVSLEIELVRILISWKCVTYNIICAYAQQTRQPSTRPGILKDNVKAKEKISILILNK